MFTESVDFDHQATVKVFYFCKCVSVFILSAFYLLELIGKAIFVVRTGLGIVQPASSDFWKEPLVLNWFSTPCC